MLRTGQVGPRPSCFINTRKRAMPLQKILPFFLAAASLSFAGMAHAGPPVEVTFKNLGTEPALYKVETTNEASTYQNASPKPQTSVSVGSSNSYRVQNIISPNANAAIVRYTMGRKICVFGTTYVNVPSGASQCRNGTRPLLQVVAPPALPTLPTSMLTATPGELNST